MPYRLTAPLEQLQYPTQACFTYSGNRLPDIQCKFAAVTTQHRCEDGQTRTVCSERTRRRRKTISRTSGQLAQPGDIPLDFSIVMGRPIRPRSQYVRVLIGSQRGYRHPLEAADVPLLHPKYRAADITSQVQNEFRARCAAGDKNPLWGALFSAFKAEFYIGGVCRGTADCLLVLVPFLSRYLIQFTIDSYIAHISNDDGPPVKVGIGYLAGLVAMLTTQSLAHNHYMYLMSVIGGRTRAILSSSIFEKSGSIHERAKRTTQSSSGGPNGSEESRFAEKPTRKNKKASQKDQDHTAGHITNLISVDCSRIAQTVSAVHMLWTCPLACSLAIALRGCPRVWQCSSTANSVQSYTT